VKNFTRFLFLCLAVNSTFVLSYAVGGDSSDLHLMPMPQRVILGEGRLPLDGSFTIQFSGHSDPLLARAADRLLQRLQRKTGIPMSSQAGSIPNQQPVVMQIHCSSPGEAVQSIASDESYQLEVTDRAARLSAPSPIGALRGMETFLQLLGLDGQSFFVPAVKIEDRPRFAWRGLHIDVSRHWEPLEVIRRNLDAMAAVKMNVFHWHLSDDQGFRIESKKFPNLHLKGSDGKYYTQAQVREIVVYARDRGIRVIPEFDVPGHSTSWLVAYPEFASAPGPYQIERSWSVFDPCLDPTQKKVYTFLDAFIGEMAALFPDHYFHIGGDEVSGKHWNTSPHIREFKTRNGMKDNRDLQVYFTRQLHRIVAGHGKTMIGWDEILHPNLPKSSVVQLWQRQPAMADIVRKGFSGILSTGYYLDAMRPASFVYDVDPLGKEPLTAEEKARVLGGEACMWAEFVNQDNIDSRIWPRTAAIAERFWSSPDVKDTKDMYRRLAFLDRELESLGLQHRSGNLEMIERMAGDRNAAPLKQLSELLIPTALGPRQRTRKYYSFTPLNRMVDAVFPESDPARLFDYLVQEYMGNRSGESDAAQLMRRTLICWRDNENEVRPILDRSFLLNELQPLSKTIAELCSRALQAMDFIESGKKAPEAWEKETADLLSRAERPQAEMLIAITGSIRKLSEAVE
jgi:hexosaminidase